MSGSVGSVDSTIGSIVYRVKHALLEDLAASRHSRAEIAVRLTEIAGRQISEAMVDAWVAETKSHRFPAELVPAWTAVTESRRLIEALCAEAGLSVTTPDELRFAELGRARIREEKLTQELWGKA
jgi:hypothetical protein